MRRKQQPVPSFTPGIDDADAGAGMVTLSSCPPQSSLSLNSLERDIEFFDDLVSEPVLVLGVDISHLSRSAQFYLCATGVFFFSLLYGYLQELISVQICSRQLGLFLATVQFVGYTALASVLQRFVYAAQHKRKLKSKTSNLNLTSSLKAIPVSWQLYLGLSLLRAVDLGMTNLAMQYINYPAKTLMKSSRIVFTMIFGVLIAKKVYKVMDYLIVVCMVLGLAIFMHADANSSAVFQPAGVIMLTVSLICDGAISNMSENIMTNYGVGQDEFILRMYSIALVAIAGAAVAKGDMADGIQFMLHPGTYAEQQSNMPLEERSWSSLSKFMVMLLFSSMGFFGSSCSAAITKNFGALTMSITSTARKAATLFLSFVLFDNACTFQHIGGMVVFISALLAKSVRRKNKLHKSSTETTSLRWRTDVESGSLLAPVSKSFEGDDLAAKSHGSIESLTNASQRRMAVRTSRRSTSPTQRVNTHPKNGHHYVV